MADLTPKRPSFRKTWWRATRLIYASSSCKCGARMAYEPGRHADKWDCSDILLGLAPHKGMSGSVQHDDVMPFAFWKVSADRDYKPSRDEIVNKLEAMKGI